MKRPARALCIMDLSLYGRAGLSVVLPVLAACGVQACALPTALFSTHTGGFGPVAKQSEASFCKQALAHFARECLAFDAVYTGYLYGQNQFALAQAAMQQYPDAFHLVDPAMGDGGKLYSGLEEDTVAHMLTLCQRADLITPNLTESALLLGKDPAPAPDEAECKNRLAALARLSPGGNAVLITSVPDREKYRTLGCAANGENAFAHPWRHLPAHYPGTGDTFTAAVLGLLLRQQAAGHTPDLQAATAAATRFVSRAVEITWQNEGEPRSGLWLESALPLLAREADSL